MPKAKTLDQVVPVWLRHRTVRFLDRLARTRKVSRSVVHRELLENAEEMDRKSRARKRMKK